MAGFGLRATSSLLWGGRGLIVPFYSVQDCSYDLSVTDNKFTCYQCIDVSFPFHNIDDDSLQANNETDRNELFERNVINNLAEFNPYREEVSMHRNDRDTLDFRDINIQSNSRSNFYSSQEFNNLVQARYFNDKLSFLRLNIRSIRNKFDALINYLNSLDHKFSIIALTETWINNNDGDNFEIPGYNSTKLVRQNKIGGGISIFTRDDLNVKLRNDLIPENNTGVIETIFIEIINKKSKNIIVGTMKIILKPF